MSEPVEPAGPTEPADGLGSPLRGFTGFLLGCQLAAGGVIGLMALHCWLEGPPLQGQAGAEIAPTVVVTRQVEAPPAASEPSSGPAILGPSWLDASLDDAGGGYPLRFPLAGALAGYQLTDSFGDARGRSRSHAGVDIMSDKMTAVLAVASGRVRWLEGEQGGGHVALALVHDDGWRSYYMHLNNDTPGTDDGRGRGIAAGLGLGSRVEAGQLIGWVGDSGNAEGTAPHLHFELRDPSGRPVDPYLSLSTAAGS